MKPMIAIAAMSLNRVIGKGNTIPWHLAEDFKWFKRRTMGGTLIMGRKTFESIGKPLPGRKTVVVSRTMAPTEAVEVVGSLEALRLDVYPADIFVAGGGELYRQLLPQCNEVFLTVVNREIDGGDAFFPAFESDFDLHEVVLSCPEFEVRHFVRRELVC